ncbi:hypothetical protein [Xanthomonas floridensis]|uniref:Uncharacterized protein n=1 Tax=Xanthomonas floridensis TaxID=1843580 RepID=A0ABU5Q2R5_9XANT|nr:hypothetical protein [Xanthomonas floridensis]MEA5126181.1 hypothetical protein [Xanthomonas floridensis]MEA5134153.1 hypothetical protein [Xanthomonas floridensis]
MYRIRLPLVIPYPLVDNRPARDCCIQHGFSTGAGLATGKLRKNIIIENPVDHIREAISGLHGGNLLPSLIKNKLNLLSSYKEALSFTPPLYRIPSIWKYRKEHPRYNAAGVHGEISEFGRKMTPGQIVFHGGLPPPVGPVFYLDRVLSTTLCAEVAKSHAYRDGYNSILSIWVITVAQDSITKALFLSNQSRQTHGHETEVIIQAGARVSILSVYNQRAFKIYELLLH